MKIINLTNGHEAMVDDDDFNKYCKNRWFAKVSRGNIVYAVRDVKIGVNKWKRIYLHREIAGTPIGLFTDHINHNSLDCRKSNLRICSIAENCKNRNPLKTWAKSRSLGVHWDKSRMKWKAGIQVNGKYKHAGRYDNIDKARLAAIAVRNRYFGEFSPL